MISNIDLNLKLRILYGEELIKFKINGIYYEKLR